MAKKVLVIVESKAKAGTIGKYLAESKGAKYTVKACLGHVRDLPKSTLGIDPEKNFQPRYAISKDRKEIVEELHEAAAEADEVLIATDPDREGEAIAWHLKSILVKGTGARKPAKKASGKASTEKSKRKKLAEEDIHRIEFNEITKRAVGEALTRVHEINMDRVDAQQARRVLDRLVGYSLSPYLWREVKEGLSAGRVQSVALRLICDREAEIEAFHPVEYWSIEGIFTPASHPEQRFSAELVSIKGQKIGLEEGQLRLADQRLTDDMLAQIRKSAYKVAEVKESDITRRPSAPYKTSTLQQDASKKLGLSPREAMRLAQQLYEGIDVGEGSVGLITYMRTDSTRLAADALDMVRGFIPRTYGAKYLPADAQHYGATGKNVQDAHEAIRPTNVDSTPERVAAYLNPKQLKLYRMIWQRFVASQMAPGIDRRKTIGIEGAEFGFRATRTEIVFDGYRKVTGVHEKTDPPLPPLAAEEALTLHEAKGEQHFTQPPPRYTNASLVKALEEKGIGRPSTYAPTLGTLRDREYVTVEKSTFAPTPLGRQVDGLLKQKFPGIIDVDFTRRMEEQLDAIETEGKNWIEFLREFYGPFQATLIKALDESCPKCGQPLILKNGPFGTYIACTACEHTKNLAEQELEEKCPECESPLQIKMGRFGRFVACTNYPACKFTRNMGRDGSAQPEEKVYSEEPCPDCGGKLVLRTSRAGRFWGCETYPKCKGLRPYTIEAKCPRCGSGIAERKITKGRMRGKPFYPCVSETCDFVAWAKPRVDEHGVAIEEPKKKAVV